MEKKGTTVAIVYDFDRTLSTSEMQDTLLRSMGLEPKAFWDEAGAFAKEEDMDRVLSYLYGLLAHAKEKEIALNRETLSGFGKDVEFYPGVKDWFRSIDEIGKQYGVTVRHCIISSGLKEIIDGSSIRDDLTEVYACEYLYDKEGKPVWLKNVVNYTTKTQFLFRINKGCPDLWDDESVNKYIPKDERPIPFENMVYIGDGETDIPCMKLVREYGGHSIGVYADDASKVKKMMYDDRINFICKADYRKGKDLYNIISDLIRTASIMSPLRKKGYKQFKESEELYLEKDQ